MTALRTQGRTRLGVVLLAVAVILSMLAVRPTVAAAQAAAIAISPAEVDPGGQVTVASPPDAGCPAGMSPFVAILGRTAEGVTLQVGSLALPARGGTWRSQITIPDDTVPGTYAMQARCFSDADTARPRLEYQVAPLVVRRQMLGSPQVERGADRRVWVRSVDRCVPPPRTTPPSYGPPTIRASLLDPSGAVRDQVIAGVQPDGSWAVRLTLPPVPAATTFRVLANCRVFPEARAPYATYGDAVVEAEAVATTTTSTTPPTTAPPPPVAVPEPVPVTVPPTDQLPVAAPATPVVGQPNYTG